MLTDIASWHNHQPGPLPPVTLVKFGVVLVGKSTGKMPTSIEDLEHDEDILVTKTLNSDLIADDHAIIRDFIGLFSDYVFAVTEGRLRIVPTSKQW